LEVSKIGGGGLWISGQKAARWATCSVVHGQAAWFGRQPELSIYPRPRAEQFFGRRAKPVEPLSINVESSHRAAFGRHDKIQEAVVR